MTGQVGDQPDGAALRRQWDAMCDETRSIVEAARDRAGAAGDDVAARYLTAQLPTLRSLKAAADGRRSVPGKIASGLLHDAPPEIREYEDAYQALDRLAGFWHEGMHLPGWNWAEQGFPPGWNSGLGDRLRAGVFYRAR